MRTLHVIDVLTLGGGQALALRVLKGLLKRGEESALCVLLTERRTHPIWRLPLEPRYLEFHGDYRRPVSWRRCVQELRDQITAFRPDVVHSLNWLADVTAARACAAARVPHVAYLVDRRDWLRSPLLKHALRRRMTRRAFTAADTRCMAVSAAVADYVAQYLPLERSRIEVVRNSVDVAPFAAIAGERGQGTPGEPVTIGMLSRLDAEKGHQPFLEAVGQLVHGGIPVRVLIGGEGPLRGEIENQIARSGLDRCVTVMGLVDDVRDFYRACEVFAVPSIHSEGLPTTILEAMAAGCVVVATHVGGACEVIDTGVDGMIVEPENPAALAEAFAEVIQDDARRALLGSRAREKALREFDMEQMLDKVQAVLGRAAASPHPSRDQLKRGA